MDLCSECQRNEQVEQGLCLGCWIRQAYQDEVADHQRDREADENLERRLHDLASCTR